MVFLECMHINMCIFEEQEEIDTLYLREVLIIESEDKHLQVDRVISNVPSVQWRGRYTHACIHNKL